MSVVNTDGWHLKNPGKARELAERFDEPIRSGAGWKSDSGEDYGDMVHGEQWEERVLDKARNDYDLRQSMTHAANSGKNKAIELTNKGFQDISDVANWTNVHEKMADRHGQGGAFDSASDYMGLTDSLRIREQRKMDEKFVSQEFLEDKLKGLKQRGNDKFKNIKPIKYDDSPELAGARERLSDGTYDWNLFGEGSPNAPDNDENQLAEAAAAVAQAWSDGGVPSYLDQYKADVKVGARIGEDKEANLFNAQAESYF